MDSQSTCNIQRVSTPPSSINRCRCAKMGYLFNARYSILARLFVLTPHTLAHGILVFSAYLVLSFAHTPAHGILIFSARLIFSFAHTLAHACALGGAGVTAAPEHWSCTEPD
eukprot:1139884-Pelagomonas_calceolata.AAC.2